MLSEIKNILDVGINVIDRFIPDKKLNQEARLALIDASKKSEQMVHERLIIDAKNEDKYISRARPTFLYVIYIMILGSIVYGLASVMWPDRSLIFLDGFAGFLHAIPEILYKVFATCFGVYTFARSADKRVK